jgi:hypothetical protein
MGVGGWCHTPAALAMEMTHYPLYKKLGGPQVQSGHVWEISPLNHPAHGESLYWLSYRGTVVGMPVSTCNYLCDERLFFEPTFLSPYYWSFYLYWNIRNRWSHWLHSLRRAANRLLRLLVWILPGAWMFVCCECCVLSGRGLCEGLITHPEESTDCAASFSVI